MPDEPDMSKCKLKVGTPVFFDSWRVHESQYVSFSGRARCVAGKLCHINECNVLRCT